MKDRPPRDGGQRSEGGGQSGYRRTEQPRSEVGGQTSEVSDFGATKIHVGRCKGLELRDLAPEQVQALVEKWLPTAKANAKPTADDRRLSAALEWWVAAREKEADDVQF